MLFSLLTNDDERHSEFGEIEQFLKNFGAIETCCMLIQILSDKNMVFYLFICIF